MSQRFLLVSQEPSAALNCALAASLTDSLGWPVVAVANYAPSIGGFRADAIFIPVQSFAPACHDAVGATMRWKDAGPVLAIGADSDGDILAQMLAAGARDFVIAPLRGCELLARLNRALDGAEAVGSARQIAMAAASRRSNLIGSSASFAREVAKLAKIAKCDSGVLILGETGTGKEVFAQAIHYSSSRAAHPWVAVNCAAIPNDLVEDELFGHVKGAYTTAHAPRVGLVKEAEGGTLFLDDIDCMPLSAQAKLLRFLQEREYRVVGSNKEHQANVRFIAASNRDLAALTAAGVFRGDLYFRLHVLSVTLPPLRERQDDIPALAAHFLRHFSKQHNQAACALTPQALEKLLAYSWPGNIRELQHVIERSVLLANASTLEADDVDLPSSRQTDSVEESFQSKKARVVEQFERSYIEQLLKTHRGNVTHAARAACKNRRAFFALMRKHGIASERYRLLSD